MTQRLLLAAFAACLALRASAADAPPAKEETPAKHAATKEEIQARLAEHTRKKEAQAAADKEAATKVAEAAKADAAATAAPVAPGAKTAPATPTAATAKAEAPAQVLPKVDVRKERVTELDIQLEKQNQQIAREKAAAKPTVLDDTLNGSKISKALSIFGGQSSEDRANIAKERIAMMEDEKDILEAIAQAQTKEEKAELEKLLAQMRETRRELENSLK